MHARASCIASTNLNPRRIDSLIIHEIGLGVNSPLCRERRTVVQARLSFIINTARTTLVLPKSIVQSASVLATGAGGGCIDRHRGSRRSRLPHVVHHIACHSYFAWWG